MMLILAFRLDIEIDGCAVGEAFEEMEEHLGRHLTHLLTMEFRIPYEPRTASKVKSNLTQAIVHRQTIAIALYATFVAQGFAQTFAKGQCYILNGMMFVHLQIALTTNIEVNHAMLGNLFQHVVEEAEARLYVTPSVAVQTDAHIYVCLLCRAPDAGCAFAGKKKFGNLFPSQVGTQNKTAATEILSQFRVCLPVANDIAACQIIVPRHIVGQHACSRLACRQVVLRKTAVDMDGIEGDTLAFQYVEHEVLRRPEGILRIAFRAKPILIADNNEEEVRMLTQETQGADGTRHKAELLEAVYLFVGRFLKDCPVAVDEKQFFQFTSHNNSS